MIIWYLIVNYSRDVKREYGPFSSFEEADDYLHNVLKNWASATFKHIDTSVLPYRW